MAIKVIILLICICYVSAGLKMKTYLPPFIYNARHALEMNPPPTILPAGAMDWSSRYWKFCYTKAPETAPKVRGLEGQAEIPDLGGEWTMFYLGNKYSTRSSKSKLCLYTINTYNGIGLVNANDTTHIYGAVRQHQVSVKVTAGVSYRTINLSVKSITNSPITISVPHGTVVEAPSLNEMPLFTLHDATFHLLPGHTYTMILSTYSLSLHGRMPKGELKLTPYVFWAERPMGTINTQREVWFHTDGGRQYQIKDLAQSNTTPSSTGLVVLLVLGALTILGQYAELYHSSKSFTPNSNILASASLIFMSCSALKDSPIMVPNYVLLAFADLVVDYWPAVIGALIGLGVGLYFVPSNKYFTNPSMLTYAPMIFGLGIAMVSTLGEFKSIGSVVAAGILILFHLPHILAILTTIPLISIKGISAATEIFSRVLSFTRATIYPIIGAPMLVIGANALLDGPATVFIDGFGVEPTETEYLYQAKELVLPTVGLALLSVVVHLLLLRPPTTSTTASRGKKKEGADKKKKPAKTQ